VEGVVRAAGAPRLGSACGRARGRSILFKSARADGRRVQTEELQSGGSAARLGSGGRSEARRGWVDARPGSDKGGTWPQADGRTASGRMEHEFGPAVARYPPAAVMELHVMV